MSNKTSNKKATILYYSYENEEFIDLTLEEIGAICMGLLAIDQNKEIREDAFKVIENDRTLKLAFREMTGKTKRATENWHLTAEKYNKKILISPNGEKTKTNKNEDFIFKKYEFENFNFEFYCDKENIPKNENKFFEKIYEVYNKEGLEYLSDIWYFATNDQWEKGWENYF